jgi:hypothetical protein
VLFVHRTHANLSIRNSGCRNVYSVTDIYLEKRKCMQSYRRKRKAAIRDDTGLINKILKIRLTNYALGPSFK